MKIIKGWKRLSHEDGFLNDTTAQTVAVLKKDYSSEYHVLLFECGKTDKKEGKKISPDYPTKPKADTFAEDWMKKHPNGTTP